MSYRRNQNRKARRRARDPRWSDLMLNMRRAQEAWLAESIRREWGHA